MSFLYALLVRSPFLKTSPVSRCDKKGTSLETIVKICAPSDCYRKSVQSAGNAPRDSESVGRSWQQCDARCDAVSMRIRICSSLYLIIPTYTRALVRASRQVTRCPHIILACVFKVRIGAVSTSPVTARCLIVASAPTQGYLRPAALPLAPTCPQQLFSLGRLLQSDVSREPVRVHLTRSSRAF